MGHDDEWTLVKSKKFAIIKYVVINFSFLCDFLRSSLLMSIDKQPVSF